MKKLAIYGAGGHGRVVADTASVLGWQEIIFYDEAWPQHQNNSIWPVVGSFKNLLIDLPQFASFVMHGRAKNLLALGAQIRPHN